MLTGGYIPTRTRHVLSPLNLALCEGWSPVLVHEDLRSPGQIIAANKANTVLWPEQARTGARLRTAKVGHADRPNRHGRIYPRAVWQDQIARFEGRLQHGYLTGAVDNLGPIDGGNLRSTCMIWRELWMEADGSVYGRFQLVDAHQTGKNLAANIAAGMKVGFSTFGYGTAHQPTDQERRLHRLADGEIAVVMNRDFRLTKIDATDDPAFEDARIC